jgi:hypothetical protein
VVVTERSESVTLRGHVGGLFDHRLYPLTTGNTQY